jgi:hypothetical protein
VNFEKFSVTGGTATVRGTASFDTANFNSGDTTFANGMNLTATNGATVSAGAKISVGSGSTATITGDLNHGGGLSLADDGTLVVTGNVAMKSGSTTSFGLQPATNGVVTSGTITLDSGSQTIVDVTSATGLLHNATFVVGTGTTVSNNAGSGVTDNSFLFDFTQKVVDGDKWVLTANQAFFNCGFTSDINQIALCNQVVSLVGSNPDAATILSRLGTITNTAEFLLAIDSLSPGDSFGGQQLSFTFARLFMSSLQDWLDSNGGANPASLSLLEKPKQLWNHPNADWQLWSNSAFSFGFQDAFSTANSRINDFDSNSTVHVMGLDRNFDDGDTTDGPLRVGLAASYGYGWGEETLTTNSPKQIEQQSFGALAYGAANHQGYKLSGKLGYAFQWSDHRRHIPILGETAKADYGSHQFFGQASIEPRQNYRLGEWDFSPRLSYNLQRLYREGYRETGSAANLIVGSSTTTRHEATARFTLGRNWSDIARGEGYVEYGRNFGDDAETTARLTAGAGAFKVQGINADDEWFTLGHSFTVDFKDNAQFGVLHQSTLGNNSHSHDISTWLRYSF